MSSAYQTLIVGGGPAGLAVAEAAVKLGVRVLALERHNEIDYPVHTSRGCWIEDRCGHWMCYTMDQDNCIEPAFIYTGRGINVISLETCQNT